MQGYARNMGIDLKLTDASLKTAILVSLLSSWVLVGLFQYLNRYTRRRYFSIWTAGWLFYALFLTISITIGVQPSPMLIMCKNWCIATAAVLMLWGSFSFLKMAASETLILVTLLFVTIWSYASSYEYPGELWIHVPAFLFLAFASGFNAYCFFFLRERKPYLGAGLLTFGFALWAIYLLVYPFLQQPEQLLSVGFLISGVLQLFIAVSMIILVLEEVKADCRSAEERFLSQKTEAEFFRARAEMNERGYQELFEQASDAIVLVSPQLEILKMNQAAARLLGFHAAGAARRFQKYCSAAPINVSHSPEAWLKALCDAVECDLTRHDGGKVRVQVRGGPIQYGDEAAYQFFFSELTQRARLEQQLRQAEKLAALGQMVSGVAHELNNPLAAIKGYTDLLVVTAAVDEETRRALRKVAQESDRAAKLVRNFLAFARPESPVLEPVNVNELLERLRPRFQSLPSRGIILDIQPCAADPVVLGAAEQLEQLVTNLVTNAEQAVISMSDGNPGVVTVGARIVEDKIQIRVEDTGPGVPDEIAARIFEPFFTTRPLGTGTGLGLSVCHTIALNHQGRIFYQPAREGGACFVVELPQCDQPAASVGDASLENSLSPATPTLSEKLDILVVDDEASLRELIKDMLEMAGHKVTICETPKQVLSALEQNSTDLVISDFRMPGMTGGELYEKVISARPELAERFIFLTGDMVNEDTHGFFERTKVGCILKPFQLAQLEMAVSKIRKLPRETVAATP